MESTSVDPRYDARIFCDEPKGLRLGWHCSSWTRAGDRAAQRKPDLQPATMALVLRGARAAGLLKQAANAPLTQVRPTPDPTPRRFPRARIGLNTHMTFPFPNSRAAQVGGVRRFGVTTAGRAGMGSPVPAHEAPTSEVRPETLEPAREPAIAPPAPPAKNPPAGHTPRSTRGVPRCVASPSLRSCSDLLSSSLLPA